MIKFIDGKITKDYAIESDRERLKKYGYDNIENCIEEAFNIKEHLNQLEGNILFRVNIGNLEVISIHEDMKYIDYDTKSLMNNINNYKIGTGYYFKQRCIKSDDRIGRRKLYKTSKGYYFIENEYRHYLNDYISK